jgi:hypothetical protein
MSKCLREAADGLEAGALPELDAPLLAAEHEVELHSQEAAAASVAEGMLAHGLREPRPVADGETTYAQLATCAPPPSWFARRK